MKQEHRMTIGELAKKMDVSVRTLQYYDREGLLTPSARSEGGRRLYTDKDMVRLHQILSLKYLGFSLDEIRRNLLPLDSPEEVAQALRRQRDTVRRQIYDLTQALDTIDALLEEVGKSHQVNFAQYANIISMLRLKNEGYWVINCLDDTIFKHVRSRFSADIGRGEKLYNEWKALCEETAECQKRGLSPTSPEGQALAARWWEMVMEFTGGDMSLLPGLMEFDRNKEGWDETLREKQEIADLFIGEALETYAKTQGVTFPDMDMGQPGGGPTEPKGDQS